jgi:septum formation protein
MFIPFPTNVIDINKTSNMKLSKKLILASNSPRRKEILTQAGFVFEIEVRPTLEVFPDNMAVERVPVFLAEQKAACFLEKKEDQIVLCADTVVINEGQILNKPLNTTEAFEMLTSLSGKRHQVITGVAIKIGSQVHSFSDESWVNFKPINSHEINYYIRHHHPLDKAGAYGVQDFIGLIGISKIEGSFYTVMGLPIHKVYDFLTPFITL